MVHIRGVKRFPLNIAAALIPTQATVIRKLLIIKL